MKYIIALLISMIPLVELRGAVPVAIASGIPWWQALILCVIGNMIPLPGTGAWTGTLAASILDWDFKRSVIAVMLGVILAGIIMGTLSLLLGVNTFAH